MTREEFFNLKEAGALWDVGVSINRTNPLPLDKNAVFKTYDDAIAYAKGVLAYPGQFVAVVGETEVVGYLITVAGGDGATLQKLAATTASGDISADLNALTTRVGALESAVGKKANGDEAATGLYKYVDDSVAAAKPTDYDAVVSKVNTIVGTDTGKSARTIASEEVAKIVADAPESYDTLVEIATWISEHGEDAAAMNTQIAANKAAIETLNKTDGTEGSVKKTVDDAITALDLANTYAAKKHTHVVADITDLDTKLADYQPKGNYATVSQVNDVSAKLGTIPEDSSAATVVEYAKEVADAAKGASDTVKSTVDALIGTDTGKTIREIANDEFDTQLAAVGVSAEKTAKWDSAVYGITAGGESITLASGIAQIPAATAAAYGVVKVDNTSIEAADGVISVKAVNVNKLIQTEGEEFILDGGNAS